MICSSRGWRINRHKRRLYSFSHLRDAVGGDCFFPQFDHNYSAATAPRSNSAPITVLCPASSASNANPSCRKATPMNIDAISVWMTANTRASIGNCCDAARFRRGFTSFNSFTQSLPSVVAALSGLPAPDTSDRPQVTPAAPRRFQRAKPSQVRIACLANRFLRPRLSCPRCRQQCSAR